ncbi:hypothetical protein SDC9_92069 [bioreactor metagenome]|uniref:Uncharacterized protein n=1 Tax=bioreactor metagenome TaxID=1076179 RepID=A0A644ZX26_9ZZZZ
MQRFKDRNIVTPFDHVAGKSKPCRAGAHYGNLNSIGSRNFGNGDVSAFAFEISGKSFQIADSYRVLTQFLRVKTLALTLPFLRTNSTANGR